MEGFFSDIKKPNFNLSQFRMKTVKIGFTVRCELPGYKKEFLHCV